MRLSVTFPGNPPTKESLTFIKSLSEAKQNIYQVRSTARREDYALKLFPKDRIGDFQYEREILISQFSHPNIVQYIPMRSHEKSLNCVLTEYSSHGTFHDLVVNRVLDSETIVRTYFHQLISGLEYLHSQGVAHLDLKLANLMVGLNFELKIIDFDQAQLTSDNHCFAGGTLGYRAPEIANHACTDLFAADIFSAGIILFTLLTKEMPFAEPESPKSSSPKSYNAFIKDNKGFWEPRAHKHPVLTEELTTLINGMVNENPSKRFKLKDIKNSKWFKGRTVDGKVLRERISAKYEQMAKRSSTS